MEVKTGYNAGLTNTAPFCRPLNLNCFIPFRGAAQSSDRQLEARPRPLMADTKRPVTTIEPTLKREDQFRSFIENLPVMFYAVDAEPPHKPMYISPTFSAFGYRKAG